MTEVEAKLGNLRALLHDLGSAAVAFSSGVDSTFLLRVAHEELGDHVMAVTIRSHTFPKRELDEAAALKDVAHMPARVKCAVLGWHTMEQALAEIRGEADR